jgi:curved DNA-binding protein CbpA
MRLGKDVVEADLYGALGLLPDATESEIRVAYRRQVRTSHPDLNQDDPEAAARMLRLNMAARVLLDPSLRRAYDRAPRAAATTASSEARPARRREWFERREQTADDDWASVPPPVPYAARTRSGFFSELRGRDGQWSLQLQELIESLSGRQQLGIAAVLFAVALGLIVMARPQSLIGDSTQPTSVRVDSVYP